MLQNLKLKKKQNLKKQKKPNNIKVKVLKGLNPVLYRTQSF